jgi:hypothetical protein
MKNATSDASTEEVLHWLRDYLRLRPSTSLTPDTRINLDLGVDGDDGLDLVRDFGERFSVDLESFPCNRYFGAEASASPLALVSMIWRWMSKRKLRSVDPLFVRDLISMLPQKP